MSSGMERSPVVAGRFYPGDADTLSAEVTGFLGPDLRQEPALAVVAPHAGYMYSGAIAGSVYAAVRIPSVVVVMCPNHTGHGARGAIMTHGTWRVPVGRVPIEEPVAEELRGLALLTEDARAHTHEHAIEVHLPFLLKRNPRVRIVPIVFGHMPYASCVRIGHALSDVVKNHGRDVLLVASTDMSHYIPEDRAREKDRMALDAMEALDAQRLYDTVEKNDISMCGYIPTTISLLAAKELGATEAKLLRYGHSGEVNGDLSRVVGYAGMVIR